MYVRLTPINYRPWRPAVAIKIPRCVFPRACPRRVLEECRPAKRLSFGSKRGIYRQATSLPLRHFIQRAKIARAHTPCAFPPSAKEPLGSVAPPFVANHKIDSCNVTACLSYTQRCPAIKFLDELDKHLMSVSPSEEDFREKEREREKPSPVLPSL